jgi:3-oxoacyl-[acyl-carrier protein] reductase
MAATATDHELKGRVAVVTGAGRNIGRAIALELAGAGAAVVVNARASRAETEAVAAEIDAAGGRALATLADVTDEAAVARMAEATLKRFGRVDIVVNNAAVRREADIDSITLAQWREILAIILDGAFIVTKAFLPHLKAGGDGAIVNIGGLT